MRILNLYSGLGGNRKLWGNSHHIVAVENNPDLCKIYHDLYPSDWIIQADAHQYLLDHYNEFDFIWTSPPCQSHSSFRFNICVRFRGTEPTYPDMRLYQEILFLKHHCKCKWVVENVKPYYTPIIEPTILLQRHLFWSNFGIEEREFPKDIIRKAQIPDLQEMYGIDLGRYKIPNKRQVLRNCVNPDLGKYILQQSKRG